MSRKSVQNGQKRLRQSNFRLLLGQKRPLSGGLRKFEKSIKGLTSRRPKSQKGTHFEAECKIRKDFSLKELQNQQSLDGKNRDKAYLHEGVFQVNKKTPAFVLAFLYAEEKKFQHKNNNNKQKSFE